MIIFIAVPHAYFLKRNYFILLLLLLLQHKKFLGVRSSKIKKSVGRTVIESDIDFGIYLTSLSLIKINETVLYPKNR